MLSSQAQKIVRVHIDTPFSDLPVVRTIGMADTRQATPWIVHSHPIAEVHYLERGLIWCWLGTELVRVTPGHVVLTLPFERHGSRYGSVGPIRMYWTGLSLASTESPDRLPGLGLSPREAADLVGALLASPRRTVPATPTFVAAFEHLLASVEKRDEPRSVTRARTSLLEILLALVDEGERTPAERSPMVAEALDLMQAHLEDPLSPAELCAKLGWSRSQLQEAFRSEMGMAPAEYYTSLRVLEACERLDRTSSSVTQIGVDLGFTSTQYFSTAFKRVTGLSPQAFRRASARYAGREKIPAPGPGEP